MKKSEDPDKNINSGNNNDSNVTNDEFIESENNDNYKNTVKKKKDKDKKRDKVEKRLKNNGYTDSGKKKIEKENPNNENDKDHGNNENSKRREKRRTVYILGNSMVKKVNGYLLTKKVWHKYHVKVQSFSGATVSCMVEHVKPTLWNDKLDHMILHTRINDLRSEKKSNQIAKSLIDLAMSLTSDGNSVVVSGIVPRSDDLNNKSKEVSSCLELMCGEINIHSISHRESIDPSIHLNESKLLLNLSGVKVFAEHFSKFLKKFN